MLQPRQSRIQATSASYAAACINTRSLTHWARPGIYPRSSWVLCIILNLLSHNKSSLDYFQECFFPCLLGEFLLTGSKAEVELASYSILQMGLVHQHKVLQKVTSKCLWRGQVLSSAWCFSSPYCPIYDQFKYFSCLVLKFVSPSQGITTSMKVPLIHSVRIFPSAPIASCTYYHRVYHTAIMLPCSSPVLDWEFLQHRLLALFISPGLSLLYGT